MKKLINILIAILLTSSQIFPQSSSIEQDKINISSNLIYTEDFSGAIRLYKKMMAFDPYSPSFAYKLGFAYLNTFGKQDSAVIFLKKSLNLYEKRKDENFNALEAEFYLARAYRLTGNIDSCIMILEKLLKTVSDSAALQVINRELKLTEYSMDKFFTVENLGPIINTGNSEHSPVYFYRKNILVFTARRGKNLQIDDEPDEDIYISFFQNGNWSQPRYVSDLNTEYNEATVSLVNPDENFLLIYKGFNKGDIYQTEYDNGRWTTPVPLPAPINSRYRETHACFSPTKDTIIFTSNRPGGKGGMDLWLSYKLQDGSWSEPQNLNINTSYDEESPFLSYDGQTLYFSSDRPGGYGGYDIYKCRKTDFGTWSKPENLGYPVNSIDDDIFFQQIPKTHKAFYTSYKYDSRGGGDIYIVNLDSCALNITTTNIGFIYDSSGNPVDSVNVLIINLDDGKEQLCTPKNGKFIFFTKPAYTYKLFIKHNDNIVYEDSFSMPEDSPEERFYKRIVLK